MPKADVKTDAKALIAAKVADIQAHETLDFRRKSHAIQTLHSLSPSLVAPDADVSGIVSAEMAKHALMLSENKSVCVENTMIEKSNAAAEAQGKVQLVRLLKPMPHTLTEAQRNYTESIMRDIVAELS